MSKCHHCSAPAKATIAVGGKFGDFCLGCYNGWLDLRDKLVREAFGEYIKDGSSPKKSSTPK